MELNNPFLKATALLKEYAILEILAKEQKLSQRMIAKQLQSSLSMINQYLINYEKNGYIKRRYIDQKNVVYSLTKRGNARLKELNLKYFKSVRDIYYNSKEMIIIFFKRLISSGFVNIILYGAGEVAEFILQILFEKKTLPVNILAVVDDDIKKQGKKIMGFPIISNNKITEIDFDGIFISSDVHNKNIYNKIKLLGYEDRKIINYFNK